MKKKLILFGAGGHSLSVIDVIEKTKKFQILFLVDNYNGKIGDYNVLKQNKDLNYYHKHTKNVLISLGQIKNYKIRENLFKKLKKLNYVFPKIISPFAVISKHSKILDGTIVMHNAIVNSATEIGENCIINTGSLIEHGSKIGNNCHISTASVINGDCILGSNIFLGSNSTLFNGINIGSNSIVGAGKVLKKNLKKNSVFK